MEESKGKGMDQLSLPQEGEGMEAVPVNLFPVAEGPIATKIREVVQNSSLLPSNIEILNISNYVRTLRALGMRRMNARVVEKTKLSDKFTAKIWKMKFDPSERQFVPVLSTVGRKYKTKAQARDAAIKAAQERDAEPEFYVDENGKYASDAEIKEFLARQGVESPRSMASSMTGTTMKSAATRRTVGSVRTKFTQATSKTKSRAKKTLDNTPRWKRCEETYLKIIVVSEKFKGYAFPYQFSMLHSVICQAAAASTPLQPVDRSPQWKKYSIVGDNVQRLPQFLSFSPGVFCLLQPQTDAHVSNMGGQRLSMPDSFPGVSAEPSVDSLGAEDVSIAGSDYNSPTRASAMGQRRGSVSSVAFSMRSTSIAPSDGVVGAATGHLYTSALSLALSGHAATHLDTAALGPDFEAFKAMVHGPQNPSEVALSRAIAAAKDHVALQNRARKEYLAARKKAKEVMGSKMLGTFVDEEKKEDTSNPSSTARASSDSPPKTAKETAASRPASPDVVRVDEDEANEEGTLRPIAEGEEEVEEGDDEASPSPVQSGLPPLRVSPTLELPAAAAPPKPTAAAPPASATMKPLATRPAAAPSSSSKLLKKQKRIASVFERGVKDARSGLKRAIRRREQEEAGASVQKKPSLEVPSTQPQPSQPASGLNDSSILSGPTATTLAASLDDDDGRLQKLQRQYKARLGEITAATVLFQLKYRQHLAYRSQRMVLKQHRAATDISRAYRGYVARVFYKELYRLYSLAALTGQRLWRGIVARRRVALWRKTAFAATIRIQKRWRGVLGRRWAYHVKNHWQKHLLLQSLVRGFLGRRKAGRVRKRLHHKKVVIPAAIKAQKVWRGLAGRRRAAARKHEVWIQRVKIPAVIRMQCFARRVKATAQLKVLRKLKFAAVRIQCAWRVCRAKRELRVRQVKRRRYNAIVTVQCAVRQWIARRLVDYMRRARRLVVLEEPTALFLQAWARGCLVRGKIHRILLERRSAARLQRVWRNYVELRQVRENWRQLRLRYRDALATRIQAAFRGYVDRKKTYVKKMEEMAHRIVATRAIQRWWRGRRGRVMALDAMEKLRIRKGKMLLEEWMDEAIEIREDIRSVKIDIFNQEKLRKVVINRLKELRAERKSMNERIATIEVEMNDLDEREKEMGWAEAYEVETAVLKAQLEMSAEEVSTKRLQALEKAEAIEQLYLEQDELELELDEALQRQVEQIEYLRRVELEMCMRRRDDAIARAVFRQRIRWKIKSRRTKVLERLDEEQMEERMKLMGDSNEVLHDPTTADVSAAGRGVAPTKGIHIPQVNDVARSLASSLGDDPDEAHPHAFDRERQAAAAAANRRVLEGKTLSHLADTDEQLASRRPGELFDDIFSTAQTGGAPTRNQEAARRHDMPAQRHGGGLFSVDSLLQQAKSFGGAAPPNVPYRSQSDMGSLHMATPSGNPGMPGPSWDMQHNPSVQSVGSLNGLHQSSIESGATLPKTTTLAPQRGALAQLVEADFLDKREQTPPKERRTATGLLAAPIPKPLDASGVKHEVTQLARSLNANRLYNAHVQEQLYKNKLVENSGGLERAGIGAVDPPVWRLPPVQGAVGTPAGVRDDEFVAYSRAANQLAPLKEEGVVRSASAQGNLTPAAWRGLASEVYVPRPRPVPEWAATVKAEKRHKRSRQRAALRAAVQDVEVQALQQEFQRLGKGMPIRTRYEHVVETAKAELDRFSYPLRQWSVLGEEETKKYSEDTKKSEKAPRDGAGIIREPSGAVWRRNRDPMFPGFKALPQSMQ